MKLYQDGKDFDYTNNKETNMGSSTPIKDEVQIKDIINNVNANIDIEMEAQIKKLKDARTGCKIEKDKMPTPNEEKLIEAIIDPLQDTGSPIPNNNEKLSNRLRKVTQQMYAPKKPKDPVDLGIRHAIMDADNKILFTYKNKAELERLKAIIDSTLKHLS